jgi:hypothetical protein
MCSRNPSGLGEDKEVDSQGFFGMYNSTFFGCYTALFPTSYSVRNLWLHLHITLDQQSSCKVYVGVWGGLLYDEP